MNTSLFYENLEVYSLQIGLLVALAALVPAIVRLRAPRARLLYWQLLLAACLLLPLVRPWRQQTIAGDVEVSTTVMRVVPAAPHHRSIPWNLVPLMLLAGGVLGRMAWLGVGFRRLRRFRLHAVPLGRSGTCPTLLSNEIASPVTFGLLRPVILLPARFPDLPPAIRHAILCHESLHVARRDWAFTVAEEMVRALFWFHPAIWWLLSEIQLAREQTVDRGVIAATGARDPYVDALLDAAVGAAHLDLVPAPLFLRRRHLKQRVVGILKEKNMSKRALISAMAAGLVLLAAACWFVTGALPLSAAPQVVADAAGVSVNLNGAPLMHRTPVFYPADAMARGVGGAVMVEVTLDANGEVSDASVLSGPAELRKAVMQSVFNWHFSKEVASSTRTVSVDFVLPQKTAPAAPAAANGPAVGYAFRTPSGAIYTARAGSSAAEAPPWPGGNTASRTITGIQVRGLSDQATEELLAKLPAHVGDQLKSGQVAELRETINTMDSHLHLIVSPAGSSEVGLLILLPDAIPAAMPAPSIASPATATPQRIRVGGNVQQNNLMVQQRPIYPPEAKAARIQGKVELQAIIGKDGHVVDLQVIHGHPLLAQAALDAVKNWVYKPTLLNGEPVEVSTVIDVNFTLAQ